MTLTVKLDKDVERHLDLHCRAQSVTKLEVVSKLIEDINTAAEAAALKPVKKAPSTPAPKASAKTVKK